MQVGNSTGSHDHRGFFEFECHDRHFVIMGGPREDSLGAGGLEGGGLGAGGLGAGGLEAGGLGHTFPIQRAEPELQHNMTLEDRGGECYTTCVLTRCTRQGLFMLTI